MKEGREKEDLRKSRSLTLISDLLLRKIGSDEEPHFCGSSGEKEKGIKKKEFGSSDISLGKLGSSNNAMRLHRR